MADRVLVSGLSTDTSDEDLVLYFESERFCSFGGEVLSVDLNPSQCSAVFQFKDPEGKHNLLDSQEFFYNILHFVENNFTLDFISD